MNELIKTSTQKLPHDGIGLLQGLCSMGGVKQQPINNVDLLQILLSEQCHSYNKLTSYAAKPDA